MCSRIMRKEVPVQLYGHSFGGALAIILAQQLSAAGYKIEKVITFGQPKIVKENELNLFR
jgi:thioesterase domain-containing protein